MLKTCLLNVWWPVKRLTQPVSDTGYMRNSISRIRHLSVSKVMFSNITQFICRTLRPICLQFKQTWNDLRQVLKQCADYILWRVYLLLGNDSVNAFTQEPKRSTIGYLLLDNSGVNTPRQQYRVCFLCGSCRGVIKVHSQKTLSRREQ
jgi:hypothetical protein